MAGALKTLFQALQQSSFVSANGINLVFGMEELPQQRNAFPLVNMVPLGGAYEPTPGYAANLDPSVEAIWEKAENVEFWIFNASSDPANQGSIDHADAIETTRQQFLSALRDQQTQYTDASAISFGLGFVVTNGEWRTLGNNAPSRFGRAYVLTVRMKVSIPMAVPAQATILNVPIVQSI